jgi:hypothetical protein
LCETRNNKAQAKDEQRGNAEIMEKGVRQMRCAEQFCPNSGEEAETHDESGNEREGPTASLPCEGAFVGPLHAPANEDDWQDRQDARRDPSDQSGEESNPKEAKHEHPFGDCTKA